MAYRYGDRYQMNIFPQSIEDYVAKDDPVRAYDAFVESLDLGALGIAVDNEQVGNPEYDPQAMLKLLIYGYAYGIRSSRKLERATHHNVSFIWLLGGLQPDHKTIARFRKNNKKALANVLKQCARVCIALGLIEGNTLFVDGSKIRANASIKNTVTRDKGERYLKDIDARIESILNECEQTDEREETAPSYIQLHEDLKNETLLRDKIRAVMNTLKEQNINSTNTVDADCRPMKSIHGAHASYNAQLVVDEKHGMIVHSDVVNDASDVNQFAEQVNNANHVLDKPCTTACADAGYADTEELKKIDDQAIAVIVPSQKQSLHQQLPPFHKDNFRYDARKNCYYCPQGHRLTFRWFDSHEKELSYQITNPSLCRSCRHFGVCTKSKQGRSISRMQFEETKEKLEAYYNRPESQAIYQLRKQKVELPFGHIKRNLGMRAFLLRGLDGVRAEMSIVASCFNIARMITLYGVHGLISRLVY